MRTVNWYHVPGSQFTVERQRAAGYYNHFSNRLILADSVLEQGDVVRHEMLHAVLQQRGHPRSQFLGACASLVDCQGNCVKAAGPWRAPTNAYVGLPVDSFEITSHAELLPRDADGQRWLSLWVGVQNPKDANVALRPTSWRIVDGRIVRVFDSTPHAFEFDLRGPTGGLSGGEIVSDSSARVFSPFETKRWLFEFRVGAELSTHSVTRGRYLVRGGYAHHWAAYDTVVVTQ